MLFFLQGENTQCEVKKEISCTLSTIVKQAGVAAICLTYIQQILS